MSGADGATVRIDADDAPVVCTAPCDVPATPGQHTLVFSRQGSRTTRLGVQVKANAVTTLRADLEAETGSLVVNSDERDAVIEIDGKTQGFTPAVLAVAVGTHDVRVTLRGFKPVERGVSRLPPTPRRSSICSSSATTRSRPHRASQSRSRTRPASVIARHVSPSCARCATRRWPRRCAASRGVFVSDDRGYKSLGFRGFGRPGDYGNRVLVLIDGMPTNDNWLWSSYVGLRPAHRLEDVERIEVVRGPGSILYGTGAFSGVVNLVTAGPDTPDGREVGMSVADDGVARARARITHHFTKDSGIWTSVAAGRGAGPRLLRARVRRRRPAFGRGQRARHRRRPGRHALRARVVEGAVASVVAQPSRQAAPRRAVRTRRSATAARTRPTLAASSRRSSSRSSASSSTSLTRAYTATTTRTGASSRVRRRTAAWSTNGYDGSWVGAEQRFVVEARLDPALTGGGEVQVHSEAHQTGSDETRLVPRRRPDFTLVAGYGIVDVTPTKAVKLSAGARLDSYSTFGSSFNPRVAADREAVRRRQHQAPRRQGLPRAEHLRALHTPAAGRWPARTLTPENIYSLEVEYSHRFSRTVIGTLATYANYIENLIALARPARRDGHRALVRFQNTSSPVGTLGGEAELRREWKEGWMVGCLLLVPALDLPGLERPRGFLDLRASPRVRRGAERAHSPGLRAWRGPDPFPRAHADESPIARRRALRQPRRRHPWGSPDANRRTPGSGISCSPATSPIGASTTRSACTTPSTRAPPPCEQRVPAALDPHLRALGTGYGERHFLGRAARSEARVWVGQR